MDYCASGQAGAESIEVRVVGDEEIAMSLGRGKASGCTVLIQPNHSQTQANPSKLPLPPSLLPSTKTPTPLCTPSLPSLPSTHAHKMPYSPFTLDLELEFFFLLINFFTGIRLLHVLEGILEWCWERGERLWRGLWPEEVGEVGRERCRGGPDRWFRCWCGGCARLGGGDEVWVRR